ncbi:MAG: tyrosine-protein phosphatase [Desulfobacterales bacterium]
MNHGHKTEKFLLDAAAERMDEHTVRICWESADDAEVTVYASENPDVFDKSLQVARSDDGCAEISGLDPLARHYFFLETRGESMLVAERRVWMDGTVNFRDLGGYKTADGVRVKWGRVFRADGLSRLSGRDIERLKNMGIKKVYDFRTTSEAEGAFDRLPEDGSAAYIHMPVSHGKFDFAEAMERLQNGDTEWLTSDFMVKGYINNLEKYPETWAAVIRELAQPEREDPVVFHCTGGKDRTGTCAALILLVLGVPEETVINDHQLSNIYIARLLPRLYRQMERAGVDPDMLFPYLTAPRECILAVVDYIIENYGTARDYLVEKAGIEADELERLRFNLLE